MTSKDYIRQIFLSISIAIVALVASCAHTYAQAGDSARTEMATRDSLLVSDTLKATIDSAIIKERIFTLQILQGHPYFNYTEKASGIPYAKKKRAPGKEMYFYLLAGILLVFAGFKTGFSKYFSDMMTLFFRRSLKQRQLKQQVSQNSLPSLLFNIFYLVVGGFYVALLVKEIGSSSLPFWQLLIYCIGFITSVYIIKFLVLKLAGWMFHLKPLTESYIFIVFLVNKIIGIMLLPVIVIIALGNIEIRTFIITISWIALIGLLVYRFVQAFGLLRKENSISPFHFILYLVAFEILPVMVIYKAVTHYL